MRSRAMGLDLRASDLHPSTQPPTSSPVLAEAGVAPTGGAAAGAGVAPPSAALRAVAAAGNVRQERGSPMMCAILRLANLAQDIISPSPHIPCCSLAVRRVTRFPHPAPRPHLLAPLHLLPYSLPCLPH